MTEHHRPQAPAEMTTESLLERAIRAFESGALRPDPKNVGGTLPRPTGLLDPVAPAPAALAPAAPAARPAPPAGRFGKVDRERVRAAGLIVPDGGITGQLEEFRIIKRQLLVQVENLQRSGGGSAAQRILVTSALPGEGKSHCAANLALSIAAEKDCDVLLVDFDSAKNTVLGALGLANGPGLIDAVADPSLDVRSCVIATDVPGLSVLPGGRSTTHDNEYMASARAVEVLDQLTAGNPRRVVLIDSPPTLAASLPVELAKLVGQTVVVVAAGTTNQSSIEDAVSLLSGCGNLQLLLNGIQFSPSGRRYGTYYS
ncbi:MAG: capsular biosynthesis protein [Sphingomonadales bacterium]|nr:capsular biosynthesis protein [Sphingomonadales bacterium]